MTVKELTEAAGIECLCIPCPDKEVKGVYIGDLLSWVMGRAEADNVWITIMSNLNVLAVASLTDVSCVVLAEGVKLDAEVLKTAEEKCVNVLCSDMSAYDIAIKLNGIIQ